MKDQFSHVRHWVFDLDNTLYPPEMRLFDQIEKRMTDYVVTELNVTEAEAQTLRVDYWKTYGTTLAGLMAHHDIDPDPFLEDVHNISFDILAPDADLKAGLSALPGRKIVYTNGTAPYAEKVLKARGLDGIFSAIYGIEHAGYSPKPNRGAFEMVFGQDGVDTLTGAMFEDDIRNLMVPHAMGMKTVLVAPDAADHDHIHHHTNDLAGFLAQIV